MKQSRVIGIREELKNIVTEHEFDRSQLLEGSVTTDSRPKTFDTLKTGKDETCDFIELINKLNEHYYREILTLTSIQGMRIGRNNQNRERVERIAVGGELSRKDPNQSYYMNTP